MTTLSFACTMGRKDYSSDYCSEKQTLFSGSNSNHNLPTRTKIDGELGTATGHTVFSAFTYLQR
jgi:hypothetical protein